MKYFKNTNWKKDIIYEAPIERKGNWRANLQNSEYHFNNHRLDKDGEWFKVLGNVGVDFSEEVEALHYGFENRDRGEEFFDELGPMWVHASNFDGISMDKDTGIPKAIQSLCVATHPKWFPKLYEVSQMFGLVYRTRADLSSRNLPPSIRVQMQDVGNMYRMHIDNELWRYCDTPHRVARITIMLDDWKPGQFFLYGNKVYDNWRAGDAHIFDWPNAPHATANASFFPRATLQITGIMTDITDRIIKKGLPL